MIIAFEGGDGVGKATQSKILSARMHAALLSFPVYETPVGRAILSNLKGEWSAGDGRYGDYGDMLMADKEINALVLQCLQTVNRLELLPAILDYQKRGVPVVLDRYWASALVYGADDGLNPDWLRSIHACLPEPDAWILIDGPGRRVEARDRYEADGRALKRRARYLELWGERRPDRRWQVVDGEGSIEQVAERVRDAVAAAGVLT